MLPIILSFQGIDAQVNKELGDKLRRLYVIRSAPVCGNGNRLTATAKRIGNNRPVWSQAVSVYWFTSKARLAGS